MRTGSMFDKYYTNILDLLTHGKSINELVEILNKDFNCPCEMQNLRRFVNQHNELKSVWLMVKDKNSTMRYNKIKKEPDKNELDKAIDKAISSDPFVETLIERFGHPLNPTTKELDNPLNVGHQTFLWMAKAMMVRNDPNSTIFEDAKASQVYFTCIAFLKDFLSGDDTSYSNIEFNLNPNNDLDLTDVDSFMNVLHKANKKMVESRGQTTMQMTEIT